MSSQSDGVDTETPSRIDTIIKAARTYGERSFDNYAQARSLAESLRDGLCAFLDPGQSCVFLVPPQGAFQAQNYGSAAFAVSGKGFLPLEPHSFGLAVKISRESDYMRLIITARKEGSTLFVQVEDDRTYSLSLPIEDGGLDEIFEGVYAYILGWFEHRVDRYDNGDYGSNDIGFDIQRVND